MSTFDDLASRSPESDPSTQPVSSYSFGQKAVGFSFNPSRSDAVGKFKTILAIAIDEMNDLRNETKSQEVKRLCSVTITELQGAQMFGVKAITWQD